MIKDIHTFPQEKFTQLESIISWYGLKSHEFMYMGEEHTYKPTSCITKFKNVFTRDYMYLISQGDNLVVQIPIFPKKDFRRGEFLDNVVGMGIKHHKDGKIAILKQIK